MHVKCSLDYYSNSIGFKHYWQRVKEMRDTNTDTHRQGRVRETEMQRLRLKTESPLKCIRQTKQDI